MIETESLNEYVTVFKAFRDLVKSEIGDMKDEDILTLFAIALKDGRAPTYNNINKGYAKNTNKSYSNQSKPPSTTAKPPQLTSKQKKAMEYWGKAMGKSDAEIAEDIARCKTTKELHALVGRYKEEFEKYKKVAGE